MSNEDRWRRIQELEDALHAREGSTTLIATVASSASVILLSTYFIHNQQFVIAGLGFFFPLIGGAYRELTINTIDSADWAELSAKERPQFLRDDERFKQRFGVFSDWRRGAIRFLLIIPSGVWAYLLWRDFSNIQNDVLSLILKTVFLVVDLVVIWSLVVFLNWVERSRKSCAETMARDLGYGEKPSSEVSDTKK